MSSPTTVDLLRLVSDAVRGGEKLDSALLAQIADSVSKMFAVQPDEVAVLTLTENRRFLKFLLPEKLQGIGEIPVSSTSSLAARSAREKKTEINNHFSGAPHASVFEAVPLAEDRGDPIQKIMSAPIVREAQVLGVVQVCRKGRNPNAAGPDFTSSELKELMAVAGLIAPSLELTRP